MRVAVETEPEQLFVDLHLEAGVVLEFVWSPEDGWEFWQTRNGRQSLNQHGSDLTGGSRIQESDLLSVLEDWTKEQRRAIQDAA